MPTTPTVRATLEDTPYVVTFSDDLGHTWTADEPQDVGGGNTAPTPDRLILASLGACTAITVKMVATRRQLPLTRGKSNCRSTRPASQRSATTSFAGFSGGTPASFAAEHEWHTHL